MHSILLRCWIAAALVLAAGCAGRTIQSLPGQPVTAFVGVTVLTMDGRGRLRDQTVAVRGERIVAIGPRGSIRLPEGTRVIGWPGQYLMPGLADMHVHLATTDDGPQFLASGITTVRDMWGNERTMQVAADFASGTAPGPRVHSAGPLIDGPGSFWAAYGPAIAATPEEARRHVTEAAARGHRSVKLYDKLGAESFRAAVAEARARGLRVYAHVPEAMTLDEVLATGVDSIEHFEGAGFALAEAVEGEDKGFTGSKLVWARARPERMAALARRFAETGTWNAPTLVVFALPARAFADMDGAMAAPEMRYVHPRALAYWLEARDRSLADSAGIQHYLEAIEAGHRMRLRLVREAFAAGAPLLIGTDTPNPFVPVGVSLHQEMAFFRDAGLTPAQVLRIATAEAARFLGEPGEFGTVQEGARADLLLLDADPEADLAALRRPTGVMAAGRWYDAAMLAGMLDVVAGKVAAAKAAE